MSARWGEPMVRRSGDVDLSASRGLSSDSVMNKSLVGAAVASLTFFGHAIDDATAVYRESMPDITSSSCPASRSIAVDRSLSAGQSQSRVAKERGKLCGARLQPLQGGAPSVGRGVLLHRCATGAAWIGCPCTLLILVLCARVAGPFSRPPSSQPMIKGALVAYGSRSLR